MKIDSRVIVILLISFIFFVLLMELIGNLGSEIFIVQMIAALIFYLAHKNDTGEELKTNRFLKNLGYILVFLYIFNFLLNAINVYSLDEKKWVSVFCQNYELVCNNISYFFYKAKIYRFITLSSYTFFAPALLIFSLRINAKKMMNFTYNFGFLSIFLAMISTNLLISLDRISLSLTQGFVVLDESYRDRFIFKQGGTTYHGWILVYADFVNQQTKPTDTIILPPQSETYKMEGNIFYFRWFVYPRNLVHYEDVENIKDDSKKFIVLTEGECSSKDCVWPNFAIESDQIESIIYIDRNNQSVEAKSDVPYYPEENYGKWGLIRLKKS